MRFWCLLGTMTKIEESKLPFEFLCYPPNIGETFVLPRGQMFHEAFLALEIEYNEH